LNEQLDYRDGHEQTDVAPVLVDRLAGGGVRVVVRYPHDVRVRARNRFFITVGAVIAWGAVGWQASRWPWVPWWGVLASGWWPFGPALVLIMAMMWWRAQRLYVLEAHVRGVTLEVHGMRRRRRELLREWIKEIRIERSLAGLAVAVTIVSKNAKRTERLFDDLGERQLTIIADALREGLGMPAAATAMTTTTTTTTQK
jgi:hypothetical protein